MKKLLLILFTPFLMLSQDIDSLACQLSDGSFVESGWYGYDTGDNWCNICFCENGILGCSELACEPQDECELDTDEDGICEDDCPDEMPTLIFDCECSFSNPNTYTVFETTINEEFCEIWEECYCECINDINENGICDEEEEGCWENGEFYDVYSQLFVDQCNYYECVVSSGFFWSELMTIDGCGEDDCPCINPDWIDPFTMCPMIYDPVTGCDGVIYSNSCVAQAAGVTAWINDATNQITTLEWDCDIVECVAQLDPNCAYMTVWDPVCGCDEKTYGNPCEAENAGVTSWIKGTCS